MDVPDGVKDLQLKGMNLLRRTLLLASGGRIGRRVGSMPVVELHTTGRTRGERRSVRLTAPVRGDDLPVVICPPR